MRTAALLPLVLAATAWSQTLDPSIEPPPGSAPALMGPGRDTGRIQRIAFSRDSKILFTQSESVLTLWDLERGLVLRGLSNSDRPNFFSTALTPGRNFLWYNNPAGLVSEKRDLTDLEIRTVSRLPVGNPNLSLAGAFDDVLLYRDPVNGRVWWKTTAEGSELQEIAATRGSRMGAALNPAGRTAGVGSFDGRLTVYDYNAKRTLWDQTLSGFAITEVQFSSDGKRIAALLQPSACMRINPNNDGYTLLGKNQTCSAKTTLTLRDAETGAEVYSTTTDAATSFALAEDGRTLALGLFSHRVLVIDWLRKITVRNIFLALDQAQLLPGQARYLRVALSADGKLLAESAIGPTRIYEVATGRLVRSLADPPVGWSSNSLLTRSGSVLSVQSQPTRIVVTELSPAVSTRILKTEAAPLDQPVVSRDGAVLASRTADGNLRVWSLATEALLCRAPWAGPGVTGYEAFALSDDGALAVLPAHERPEGEQGLELWDLKSCEKRATLLHDEEPPDVSFTFSRGTPEEIRRDRRHVVRVAISPTGRFVSWATVGNDFHIWDTRLNRFVRTVRVPVPSIFSERASGAVEVTNRLRLDGQPADLPADWSDLAALAGYDQLRTGISGINFGWDDSQLATLDFNGVARIWSAETGEQKAVLRTAPSPLTEFIVGNVFQQPYGFGYLGFSPDGRLGMAVHAKRNVPVLWDLRSAASIREFPGFTTYGCCAYFTEDMKTVVFGGGGSATLVSEVATGKPLARISTYGDGADWLVWRDDGLFDGTRPAYRQLGWLFNPSSPQRLVLPMESFFAAFFRPGFLPDLMAGKTVAPPPNLDEVDRRQARVQITAPGINAGIAVDGRVSLQIRVTLPSADDTRTAGVVRDLRLLRNGSLVQVWHGELRPGPNGTVDVSASVSMTAGANEFVAYGFNRDNIQSTSGLLYLTGAQTLARQGDAYLVVVGINQYQNPQFRLNYAVPDAQLVATALADDLRKTRRYGKVNVVSLLDGEATKANILSLLVQLAGGSPSPGAKRIPAARPQDSVFLFFAGHGWANDNRFYLIPHDLGYNGARDRLANDSAAQVVVLQHGISDLELATAVEGMDAAQLVLMIDACNAGQLLESTEERRGPFNSKALAQLAWDKGMYILTAAQSYQSALEAAQLGHGYLTYALVQEGLKDRKADRDPYDGQIDVKEWFDYAVMRVPEMQRARLRQSRALLPGDAEKGVKPFSPVAGVQTPRAFYRSEAGTPLIVAGAIDSTLLDCAQEPSLKSAPSQTAANIRWENATSSVRKLFWIDFNGNRSAPSTLAPGAILQRQTFVGHIWVFTDESDRCVGIFSPQSPMETATINK